MQNIDKIITESINHVVSMLDESKKNTKDKASSKIKKLLGKDKSDSSSKGKKSQTKKDKSGKANLKRKNVGGGRWVTYNFDDYKRDNAQSTEGDKSSILNSVDLELVDLAAVARKVFPTHTDEGAQSQLRKIFHNERPMTKKVEYKLNQMISAGEIPTK